MARALLPNTAASVTIVVQHVVPAPPERVYNAFLDPKLASKFLFATPGGRIVLVEMDRRVGGLYTFVDQRDGVDVLHTGKYLELDRPHALAFTFSVPQFSEVETVVSLDLTAEDENCVVTLTHDGVLQPWADRTQAGWKHILERAAKVLASS